MKLETAEGFGQVIAAHSLDWMFLTAMVGPILYNNNKTKESLL
jgi:hypothetical protein